MPELRVAWTIDLAESDSAYLGRPSEFYVSPTTGNFFVSDRFFGRVAEFTRTGALKRFFGHKGRGPGEFVDVARPLVHGSRLFVSDAGTGALSIFDLSSGELINSLRYQGILTHAAFLGDTIVLGLENSETQTGAAVWTPPSSRMTYFAQYPRSYKVSNPLAGIFNGVAIAAWADTILLGYQGDDWLFLYSARTLASLDSIRVVARVRRGVPEDIAARLEKLSFPEMFSSISALVALGRTSDGRIVTVHNDQTIQGRAISARVFVSVLNRNRSAWCPDAEVSGHFETQPQAAVLNDTIFLLSQTVRADRATTHITAYTIRTERCAWISVGK